MFGKKSKKKKNLISVEFRKGVKKADELAKKAESVVKKDIDIVKKDVKKLETPSNIDFFVTYGWAILIIIIAVIGFVWWQFFSVHSEYCEFIEGSGLLCENYGMNNQSFDIEIRNLNNKSITIEKVKLKSCIIEPSQNIPSNDRRTLSIPCSIGSGKLRERIIVYYKLEDFDKSAVGKILKIVP